MWSATPGTSQVVHHMQSLFRTRHRTSTTWIGYRTALFWIGTAVALAAFARRRPGSFWGRHRRHCPNDSRFSAGVAPGASSPRAGTNRTQRRRCGRVSGRRRRTARATSSVPWGRRRARRADGTTPARAQELFPGSPRRVDGPTPRRALFTRAAQSLPRRGRPQHRPLLRVGEGPVHSGPRQPRRPAARLDVGRGAGGSPGVDRAGRRGRSRRGPRQRTWQNPVFIPRHKRDPSAVEGLGDHL